MGLTGRLEEELRGDFDRLPGGVQLAVALSAATRIEPELVRAMRLTALPRLDVGAESDLWFGDLVGARGPDAVSLRAEALPVLREALARRLRDAEPSEPIRLVWHVLDAVHRPVLPPTLYLEEQVTRLALSGSAEDLAEAARRLRRAHYSLVVERRDGIADWAFGAWRRLPRSVLATRAAWRLAQVVNKRLDPDRVSVADVPPDLTPQDAWFVEDDVGTAELPVSLGDGVLRLGGERGDGEVLTAVATDPVLVEVTTAAGSRVVRVRAGGEALVAVPAGAVRVRTSRRHAYDLRELPRPGVLPVFGPRGGAATGEVLPSTLLERAPWLAEPVLDDNLPELTRWLSGSAAVAVRLLYEPRGDGLTEVAAGLARTARAAGWDVRRALPATVADPARPVGGAAEQPGRTPERHRSDRVLDTAEGFVPAGGAEPDPAGSFASAGGAVSDAAGDVVPVSDAAGGSVPAGGAVGRLLVVEDTAVWPPAHLAHFLDDPAAGPLRVVVLDRSPGRWWEALQECLPEAEVSQSRVTPPQCSPTRLARAFGDALDITVVPPAVPSPAPPATVAMTALAAALTVRGHAPPPDDPARLAAHLLACEAESWPRLLGRRVPGLAEAVLSVTLAGPVTREAARRLVEEAPGGSAALLDAVTRCYPPDAGDEVVGIRTRPLVADLVDAVAAGAPRLNLAGRAVRAVFDRLVAREDDVARHALARVAAADGVGPRALVREVAATRPDLVATSPDVVLAALAASADPETVEEVVSRLPPGGSADFGACLLLERSLAADLPPTTRARRRLELGRRLAAASLPLRALATAERAVTDLRWLVASAPARYKPLLAEGYGLLVEVAGEPRRGGAARAAVALLDELRDAESSPSKRELVMRLVGYGRQLAAASGGAGAVEETARAVDIYRALARSDADRFAAELAVALSRHAHRLAEAGDRAAASAAAGEASRRFAGLTGSVAVAYREEAALAAALRRAL
ncbi:hypothetical protein ACWEFJ_31190 [Actinosynnema sp. NPDC004786]